MLETDDNFLDGGGVIGHFQGLDEDQQQGFTGVCGQKEGHGQDERVPAM